MKKIIKLDHTKMLGFKLNKQAPATCNEAGKNQKLGSKIGSKMGGKPGMKLNK